MGIEAHRAAGTSRRKDTVDDWTAVLVDYLVGMQSFEALAADPDY